MKLAKKVASLKPSPTLALAAKAKAMSQQGRDIISLAVGEPDWDTFDSIKASAIEALKNGATKYTPSAGIPELRKAVADAESMALGLKYTPAEVTVSTGAKFVLFSALQVLLDPGDEVIIPIPYWVSYPTMVELAGGKPVLVDSTKNGELDVQKINQAVSSKTKLILINSPSNPSGVVYSRENLQALAQLLDQHPNVYLLSDDIYNRLVFNDAGLAPHILQSRPDLKTRTLVVNGASKSFSMTGWRVGWALGPQEWIDAMTNYQSQSVSCTSGFAQLATCTALTQCHNELRESVGELRRRRDLLYAQLREIPGLSVAEPQGAFYMWPNVSQYFGLKFQGKPLYTSRDFAEFLLESEGVALVPGVEFGMEGHLRISYVLNRDRMLEAMTRLRRFIQQLS